MIAKFLPIILSVALLTICLAAALGEGERRDEPTPIKCTLSDAYDALADALRNNDVAVLEEVFANDFMLIDHGGKTGDKPGLLKAIGEGIIVIRSLEPKQSKFKEFDNSGVVQGPVRLHISYGRDEPVEISGRFAVTTVFVYMDGRWQLSAAQMTTIKPRQ